MNDKEQLDKMKELKELYYKETTVPDYVKEDIDWLVNQAERVGELEKENEEYEHALEFYGNEGNYKTVIENDKEIKFLGTSLAQMDGGEVARKVLDFSRNYGGLDE